MQDNERSLATVRCVDEIFPIEGADNIEVIVLGGWQVVTKKGEYAVGDLCIYFEIDSLLPIHPDLEFLRDRCYKVMDGNEGYRLRTIKLRGQISQGLVVPLSFYPPFAVDSFEADDSLIGTDLTSKLNVLKYEKPIAANLAGKVRGNFPVASVRKTSETRVQNVPWNRMPDDELLLYGTEKLDGSSFTAIFNDGDFSVCSRNLNLEYTEGNSFWEVAKNLDLETKMTELGMNIAIQGELIGAGVQGNRYALEGRELRGFYVFDISSYSRMSYFDSLEIFERLGVEPVPLVVENMPLPDDKSELIAMADGKSKLNPNAIREGIVFRSYKNNDVSFKAISNKFLLKEKD